MKRTRSLALFLNSANAATAPRVFSNTQDVQNFLCAALVWMFWGLLVLSVAMFLAGGYIYATAAGDPEKVGKANKTLLYAAIAVAVALVAKVLPLLIGSFLGVSASQLNAC